jgi:diacylglycerol O-acyltransferase-1
MDNTKLNTKVSRSGDMNSGSEEIEVPPHKVGYLSKYQDREVSGLSGSKWAKRFVVLENGNLSYYKEHTDQSPRYVLNLKDCAVRDDGAKPVFVRKFGFAKEETGKFYHIFSIYNRPQRIKTAEEDDPTNIVPLLRFSTQSLAEKNQWVDLLSQACAYCDSEAYGESDSNWRKPATAVPTTPPSAREEYTGTLPPIYFGKHRRPSLKDAKRYINSSSAGSLQFQTDSAIDPRSKSTSAYPPSRPMHRSAEPSPLSAEASEQNYRGLLNLAMLLLFVSNFRLLMDTMKKYGDIFDKFPAFGKLIQSQAPLTDFPFLSGLATIPIFLMQAFLTEYSLSQQKITERTGLICHSFASSLALLVPLVIVWKHIDQWILGNLLMTLSIVTWMKLISYAHANSDYRKMATHKKNTMALILDVDPEEASIEYPDNITFWNLCYFWMAPTLTYQIVYPRTPSPIRWAKVAGIILRLVVAICFEAFLLAQVIFPALENLTYHLEQTGGKFTASIFIDYVLQLSIANTYIWILMFYIVFHLFLNLSAELTRFGDRVFYRDWWNASEVGSYWKLWNLPVHVSNLTVCCKTLELNNYK